MGLEPAADGLREVRSDGAAWTDRHIAPAAQRDCTQIVLVCAHSLPAAGHRGPGVRLSALPVARAPDRRFEGEQVELVRRILRLVDDPRPL